MNTQTEENYLKAIFSLSQNHAESVSTNDLAKKLNTKAASVSEMLGRLKVKKLINYEKYSGVNLTSTGNKIALSIVRKHRIWEFFLVNKLSFKWDEVHEIAEQLEHVKSEELMNQLDKYLGYPKFDPHGDPIPDKNGKMPQVKNCSLSELKKIGHYKFTAVKDHSSEFLKYLNHIGLEIGLEFELVEFIAYDNSIILKIKNNKITVSQKAAENILVHKK